MLIRLQWLPSLLQVFRVGIKAEVRIERLRIGAKRSPSYGAIIVSIFRRFLFLHKSGEVIPIFPTRFQYYIQYTSGAYLNCATRFDFRFESAFDYSISSWLIVILCPTLLYCLSVFEQLYLWIVSSFEHLHPLTVLRLLLNQLPVVPIRIISNSSSN